MPGLVFETESLDDMVEELHSLVPVLMERNLQRKGPYRLLLQFG